MQSASKYWQLVRIDASGRLKVEDVGAAKTFFCQQVGSLLETLEISDAAVQRLLLNWVRSPDDSISSHDRSRAEYCLRCYISHQIEQVCIHLDAKFGSRHGFTRYDLFPFVLDDGISSTGWGETATPYQSLATKILQTFDPDRASLNTWVLRQVRHHRELNAFLREHGVYLVSDWAILNDTRSEQLQRILSEFYTLTPVEIQQACNLLQGYHRVYREDRLRQRQMKLLKGKEECLPPTVEQLSRIAQYLQDHAALTLPNESVMSRLQMIAAQLRRYRLYVRGGGLPTESLDQPETRTLVMKVQAPDRAFEADDATNDQNEFLIFYREQLLICLDQVLDQVTSDRVVYLNRKNSQTAENFLTALELFHCRGQSMSQIATQLGLQAQYQVTRLMKLKEFRANVRQKLIQELRDLVLDRARIYTNANTLHNFDRQIEAALDEHIAQVIQQAEAEAAVAKNHPLASLFARRLCHHLDARRVPTC